jgi:hypothetical protein
MPDVEGLTIEDNQFEGHPKQPVVHSTDNEPD